MGSRGKISRETPAHANQTRDWRIYTDFAQILIKKARLLYADDSFGIELEQTIYAVRCHNHQYVLISLSVGGIPQA
jgi:hypothetical protein